MNRRNWRDSPSGVSHGYIIDRTVLTKQDDSKPGREGTFLLHIESFSRGYLEGRVTTVPESHERIQEVFYVAPGRGEFDGGGVKRDIGEGDAIMVPAGVEHVLRNLADEPLEVLTVREELPDGVEPKTRQPVISPRRSCRSYHWPTALPSGRDEPPRCHRAITRSGWRSAAPRFPPTTWSPTSTFTLPGQEN